MNVKKSCKTYTIYVITGWLSLFIGSGIVLYSVEIVKCTLDNILVLKPGTIIYKLWEQPPDPNIFSVYFFNWTNSKDVYNKSIKAKFEEIGPYVYSDRMKKVDVLFNNDNNTLTYKVQRTWHVMDDLTKNVNDKVVTLNALAAVSLVFDSPFPWKNEFSFCFR